MVEISRIIEQNPWWAFGEAFFHYDKSKSMKEYNDALIKFDRKKLELKPSNIYAIYGPRQVGKTTEIKKKILELIKSKIEPESICYFSCYTLASRNELRKVLDFFLDKLLEQEKIYIFLDEVNFIKGWVEEVKRIAESDRFDRITILLTGSPFGIKVHTHELIGRGTEGNRYFMKPLTFREFVFQVCKDGHLSTQDYSLRKQLEILPSKLQNSFIDMEKPILKMIPIFKKLLAFDKSLSFLFNTYLKTGGFPAVINNYLRKPTNKERINAEFYERFIELVSKDALKQGKSDRTMQQIITAIIKNFGSRYEFGALSKKIEEPITSPTIIDYLRLMEDNFLINVLYSYDISKKSVKSKGAKKIYFMDPFIFHSFNGWLYGKPNYSFSEEFLLKETNISSLAENVVFTHLARIKEKPLIKPENRFLWFYYDVRKELDFIYQKENKEYLGIEVKYQPKVSFKDIRFLMKENLILSKNEFAVDKNTVILPIHIFLPLLQASSNNL